MPPRSNKTAPELRTFKKWFGNLVAARILFPLKSAVPLTFALESHLFQVVRGAGGRACPVVQARAVAAQVIALGCGNPPAPAPRRTISMACPPSRRLARPRSTGATLRATLAPGPRRRSRPASLHLGMRGDSGPLRKPSPAVRALAPGFECVSDSFPNRNVHACRAVRPCSCIEHPHWELTCVLTSEAHVYRPVAPSMLKTKPSKPRAEME